MSSEVASKMQEKKQKKQEASMQDIRDILAASQKINESNQAAIAANQAAIAVYQAKLTTMQKTIQHHETVMQKISEANQAAIAEYQAKLTTMQKTIQHHETVMQKISEANQAAIAEHQAKLTTMQKTIQDNETSNQQINEANQTAIAEHQEKLTTMQETIQDNETSNQQTNETNQAAIKKIKQQIRQLATKRVKSWKMLAFGFICFLAQCATIIIYIADSSIKVMNKRSGQSKTQNNTSDYPSYNVTDASVTTGLGDNWLLAMSVLAAIQIIYKIIEWCISRDTNAIIPEDEFDSQSVNLPVPQQGNQPSNIAI